jgi:hypothetical protein
MVCAAKVFRNGRTAGDKNHSRDCLVKNHKKNRRFLIQIIRQLD